jgi:hypothetical protein
MYLVVVVALVDGTHEQWQFLTVPAPDELLLRVLQVPIWHHFIPYRQFVRLLLTLFESIAD